MTELSSTIYWLGSLGIILIIRGEEPRGSAMLPEVTRGRIEHWVTHHSITW